MITWGLNSHVTASRQRQDCLFPFPGVFILGLTSPTWPFPPRHNRQISVNLHAFTDSSTVRESQELKTLESCSSIVRQAVRVGGGGLENASGRVDSGKKQEQLLLPWVREFKRQRAVKDRLSWTEMVTFSFSVARIRLLVNLREEGSGSRKQLGVVCWRICCGINKVY